MVDDNNPNAGPDWAAQFLNALKIQQTVSPREALERAETVANRLAPETRKTWKWVLAAQGAAVVAPLSWLLVVRQQWPASYTAYFVTLFTLAIIIICWWMRWKGMQHTWARARVVAEIARSICSSKSFDAKLTSQALSNAPDLQWISDHIAFDTAPAPELTLETAKKSYLIDRIDDQLAYYRKKRQESEETRKRLNRLVTFTLDTALFLAIAGIVISLNTRSLDWLSWSGSDYVLGALGVALPLIAILSQLQGSYLELNRRIGRYAQQIQFLEPAKERLSAADDHESVTAVVLDVERSLLGEVVDWYYQAEHSQLYYRSAAKNATSKELERIATEAKASRWAKTKRLGQRSLGFFFKVFVGRALVGAISIVITTAFIAFRQKPDSVDIQSVLRREDGRLLSHADQKGTAEAWTPNPKRARNGFILIAHGLHDGVHSHGDSLEDAHWMTKLQLALEDNYADATPEISLVDWENAAKPYHGPATASEQEIAGMLQALSFPEDANRFLLDVATIRTQGEAIGELVGFKLARALRRGKLDRDQPMRLIGHSAGGFVVVNAALVLEELGIAPENLEITLLDTPLPIRGQLEQLAQKFTINYYCTSSFALLVPQSDLHKNYTRFDITPPAGTDPFLQAHSYAYIWFTESLQDGKAEELLNF